MDKIQPFIWTPKTSRSKSKGEVENTVMYLVIIAKNE